MNGDPLLRLSAALRDARLGIYRVEAGGVLKLGGPGDDDQAWSGISIRLDRGDAFAVALELTLDRHLADDAGAAAADLRSHFEAVTDESYDLGPVALDPLWGCWCCTVSRRCHGVEEAVEQAQEMLSWDC